MAARAHPPRLTTPLNPALDGAAPQVEPLRYAAHFREVDRPAVAPQPDPRQVQPVRILPQPVEERLLPLAAGGVAHRPPIGVEALKPQFSRSEEHTSELQSLRHLVCRLL